MDFKVINLDNECLSPEDMAMLQALYSRSPKSVLEHLKENRQANSGSFMENYFVKYGHASIGDCGVTTYFIEGVPLYVAKHIQNTPLYNGQECSTRYQKFNIENCERTGDPKLDAYQKRFLDLYHKLYDDVFAHELEAFRKRYPKESEKRLSRAARARTFDILRGLIPVGMKTNLSWTTTLRNLREQLGYLVSSPLPEVRAVGERILEVAKAHYPHTMVKMDGPIERGRERVNNELEHWDGDRKVGLHFTNYRAIYDWLSPMWCSADMLHIKFDIDYGSWRDLQRHRRGKMKFIMLPSRLEYSPWYIERLPEFARSEVVDLVNEFIEALKDMKLYNILAGDDVRYYNAIPMMFKASGAEALWDYEQTEYVLRLRCNPSVHPTLRIALNPVRTFFWNETHRPCGVPYRGLDDEYHIERGEQTIERKATN